MWVVWAGISIFGESTHKAWASIKSIPCLFLLDWLLSRSLQNKISLGASYRTGDAIVGMVEYQVNQQLRFGYAYDKTFSNLGTLVNGTHEIMLRLEFGSPSVRVSSPRYF